MDSCNEFSHVLVRFMCSAILLLLAREVSPLNIITTEHSQNLLLKVGTLLHQL